MAIAPVRLPMPLKPLSIIDVSHVINIRAYSTTRAQKYLPKRYFLSSDSRSRTIGVDVTTATVQTPPRDERAGDAVDASAHAERIAIAHRGAPARTASSARGETTADYRSHAHGRSRRTGAVRQRARARTRVRERCVSVGVDGESGDAWESVGGRGGQAEPRVERVRGRAPRTKSWTTKMAVDDC